MEIGNKIKFLRKKAGFTQEQLASRLGVSGQSISKWENEISMPDITLLPPIAEIFGVSIDELFDFTTEEKIKRIENRIEIEEDISADVFKEYESFLLEQLTCNENRINILSLLANLYHHRMEADSLRVSKYGREAILLDPAKKDCQWLLDKAEGHAIWDWNCSGFSDAVEFYKQVIDADKGEPKSSLPYYYLIYNLLADNRADEAEKYLKVFSALPSANPVMKDIYKAYIALARHDVKTADSIIALCVEEHPNDCGYLFESAQYYARRCDYKKALQLYARSWDNETAPRYSDSLQGIAKVCKIIGDKQGATLAYERILECLSEEWGYSKDDKPFLEIKRMMSNL